MDEVLAKLDRADAALAKKEGCVPEAQRLTDGLIQNLAGSQTESLRNLLCQSLLDRVFLNGASTLLWKQRLDDLDRCEEEAQHLKHHNRRLILNVAWTWRARLLSALPRKPADYPEQMRELAEKIRALGVDRRQADWMLCELLQGEERWKRTAVLAEQDIEWALGRNMPQMVADSRLNASRAYRELGRFEEAQNRLTPALKFFEGSGPEESAAQAEQLQAVLHAIRGETEPAWNMICRSMERVENLLRQTGSLLNEQAFLQDKAGLYTQALDIALKTGGRQGCLRAWAVAERSKSYFLALILANPDASLFRGVAAEDLARLRELDGQLDHFERLKREPGRPGETTETIQGQINALSVERRTLFDRMMRDNPRWAAMRRPPVLDLEAELNRLGPGWGVVSYYWEPRDPGALLHCFFLGRDREPRHVAVDWSADDLGRLDDRIKVLRGAVNKDAKILLKSLARKVLPEELLAALLPTGESTGGEPEICLLISPHGRLQGFPIHAAPVDRGGLLIHHLPVQYIPSLALLPFGRHRDGRNPEETGGSVLLVGCEQDGFRGDPLKDIPRQIEDLGRIWETARSGRVVARQMSPKGTLEGAGVPFESWGRHEYLHVACHGIFQDERFLDASLHLGSESVRMSQFFATPLRARLVSLCACAVGRHARSLDDVELTGGEWIGFHLPLFYAGARAVLASLWNADLPVANLFMVPFHAALAKGESPPRAFRRAALSVSRERAPIPDWANWFLAGFPDG